MLGNDQNPILGKAYDALKAGHSITYALKVTGHILSQETVKIELLRRAMNEIYDLCQKDPTNIDKKAVTNAYKIAQNISNNIKNDFKTYEPEEAKNKYSAALSNEQQEFMKNAQQFLSKQDKIPENFVNEVINNNNLRQEGIPHLKKTFLTENKEKWNYKKPKEGGMNGPGEHGGFYTNDGLPKQMALIKQDANVERNIAEFLGGCIYQALAPNASAKISLTAVDGKVPSHDGKGIYVVSEFIPNFRGGLYDTIKEALGETTMPKDVSPTGEGLRLFSLEVRPGDVAKIFEEQQFIGYGEAAIPGLLCKNFDQHMNNVGIAEQAVLDQNGQQKLSSDGSPLYIKRVVAIDYGLAFLNYDSNIKANKLSTCIPGFTSETINHFAFYPEELKIAPDFVATLDIMAKKDLTPAINDAFKKISEYYGAPAIELFAKRIGVDIALLKKGAEKANMPQEIYKTALVETVKNHIIITMKNRQANLERYSARIKTDLCVTKDKEGNWKFGTFKTPKGQIINFKDVVLEHSDYFRAIVTGEKNSNFMAVLRSQRANI